MGQAPSIVAAQLRPAQSLGFGSRPLNEQPLSSQMKTRLPTESCEDRNAGLMLKRDERREMLSAVGKSGGRGEPEGGGTGYMVKGETDLNGAYTNGTEAEAEREREYV